MVSTETFMNDIYRDAMSNLFDEDEHGSLLMGFNSIIEVRTSPELKVCGAIGHMYTAEHKTSLVSDMEIGTKIRSE